MNVRHTKPNARHRGVDAANTNMSFTQDQYKGLLDLLQQSIQQAQRSQHSANTVVAHVPPAPNSATSSNINVNQISGEKFIFWIVVTGATDHSDFSLFTSYRPIKHTRINCPDHTSAIATI